MSRRARSRLTGLAAGIVALVVWEVVARTHLLVSGDSLPPATKTAKALVDVVQTGSFWRSLRETLEVALGGFLIALAMAVPLGLLIGLSDAAYRSTRPVVEFLKPIPPVVIIPLLLLTYGPSTKMGLFLVTFGCLWPLLVQTTYGVQDADPVALDTARAFRLGRGQRVLRVVLPGATPFIATGLRIAGGAAFVIAIVSELVGGAPGLGKDISLAQNAGLFPRVYALVVAVGIIGLLFYAALGRLERWVLHWHPSVRGEVIV